MTMWIKTYEYYEVLYVMGVFTEEEMVKNKSEMVKKIAEHEIEELQEQIDHIKEERKPLQEAFFEMCNNLVNKDSPSYKEYKKNRRLMAHKIEKYNKPISSLKNKIANFQKALDGDSFWVDIVLSREHIHYRDYVLNIENTPTEDELETFAFD